MLKSGFECWQSRAISSVILWGLLLNIYAATIEVDTKNLIGAGNNPDGGLKPIMYSHPPPCNAGHNYLAFPWSQILDDIKSQAYVYIIISEDVSRKYEDPPAPVSPHTFDSKQFRSLVNWL